MSSPELQDQLVEITIRIDALERRLNYDVLPCLETLGEIVKQLRKELNHHVRSTT